MGAAIVALIGGALLADAAVETAASGSPVRWWTIGAGILYATLTAATWRRPISWKGRLTIALATLLGMLAATAWLAGGLTGGVRVLGQPTARVVAAVLAAGVVVACLAVLREPRIPLVARAAVGALGAYAAVAFVNGAITRTPLADLLGGAGLWQRLPALLQGAAVGALLVLPVGLVVSVVRAGLRRPFGSSAHAEAWRLTAIATSVAIVLAAVPLPGRVGRGFSAQNVANLSSAPAPTATASTGTPDISLANALRAVEDGERETPRDRWDPAYVVSRLGTDPDRLYAWVKGNTFWIPYRGLLRGPVGVLMDRRGNSLDRAVLLATLLRQAKQTIRLARGSISHEEAVRLLPRLLTATARPVRRADAARKVDAAAVNTDPIAAVADQYHLDLASVRRALTSQAETQTRRRALLQARVPDQARRLASAVGRDSTDHAQENFDRAIEALQDHWWVQLREGDTWRDLDLVRDSDDAAPASANETFDVDHVPADLRHQVIVRVAAEQWAGGGLTERVALQQSLDTAESIGTPIVLQFTPLRAPTQPPLTGVNSMRDLRTVALDVHEWVPVLTVGGNRIVQSAIMDSGELAKPGAEELVKQSGRDAAGFAKSANDLFNPSGPPAATASAQPPAILTAVWIDYEIHVPGSPPQKIRRAVFDLIGSSARAAHAGASPPDSAATLSRSLALMMGTEILPIPCRFPREYLAHLAAASLLANREILAAAARGDLSDDFAHVQDVSNRLAPLPTPLYGLARVRFDWSRHRDEIFIDRPNVLTRHVFFSPVPTGLKLQDATDIVANDIGVDLLARDPFAIRLEQGVLDTNAEAVLASDRPDATNPGWAFETSRNWAALSGPSDPQLAVIRVPDDVRRSIGDDLAAGYVVVAPTAPAPIGSDAFAGWWRIDPRTGQSLGIGRTGWGPSIVERAVIILTGGSIAFFFAYLWCAGRAGASQNAWRSEPPRNDRRFAALDYVVVPLDAAGSVCLADAVESAVAAFLAGLIGPFFDGGGFGGSGASGNGGGTPVEGGGAAGEGGDPAPDLSKTDPDLGDTLPGPPPSGGRSGGGQGASKSGGAGEGGGQSGGSSDEAVPQKAEDAAKAWREANRQYWDGVRRGDLQAQIQAVRDTISANNDFPEGWTQVRGKPQPIIYDKFGHPEFGPPLRPSAPSGNGNVPSQPGAAPPCVGPGCAPAMSPMAKTIGGAGGTLDVVNKGGGK